MEELDPRVNQKFYCPITHHVMQEPVIAGDGLNYQRRFIEEWLKVFAISPVTGQKLQLKDCQQNDQLKNQIAKQSQNQSQENLASELSSANIQQLIQQTKAKIQKQQNQMKECPKNGIDGIKSYFNSVSHEYEKSLSQEVLLKNNLKNNLPERVAFVHYVEWTKIFTKKTFQCLQTTIKQKTSIEDQLKEIKNKLTFARLRVQTVEKKNEGLITLLQTQKEKISETVKKLKEKKQQQQQQFKNRLEPMRHLLLQAVRQKQQALAKINQLQNSVQRQEQSKVRVNESDQFHPNFKKKQVKSTIQFPHSLYDGTLGIERRNSDYYAMSNLREEVVGSRMKSSVLRFFDQVNQETPTTQQKKDQNATDELIRKIVSRIQPDSIEVDVETQQKMVKQRVRILKDWVKTEKQYMGDLNVLIQKILTPMVEKNVLSQKQINLLFPNVEIMLKLSSEMVQSIQQLLQNWDPSNTVISYAVIQLASFFRIYKDYFKQCFTANKVISAVQKVKKQQFKSIQLSLDQGQDYKKYIARPRSRPFQYNTFLNLYRKNLLTSHLDYMPLSRAIQSYDGVLQQSNRHLDLEDNRQKMVRLQQVYGDVVQPHRILQNEFIAYSFENRNLRIYVFNDLVIATYCDDVRDSVKVDISAEKVYRKISLSADSLVTIQQDQSRDHNSNKLQLRGKQGKCLLVYFSDQLLRASCFKLISRSIAQIQEKGKNRNRLIEENQSRRVRLSLPTITFSDSFSIKQMPIKVQEIKTKIKQISNFLDEQIQTLRRQKVKAKQQGWQWCLGNNSYVSDELQQLQLIIKRYLFSVTGTNARKNIKSLRNEYSNLQKEQSQPLKQRVDVSRKEHSDATLIPADKQGRPNRVSQNPLSPPSNQQPNVRRSLSLNKIIKQAMEGYNGDQQKTQSLRSQSSEPEQRMSSRESSKAGQHQFSNTENVHRRKTGTASKCNKLLWFQVVLFLLIMSVHLWPKIAVVLVQKFFDSPVKDNNDV